MAAGKSGEQAVYFSYKHLFGKPAGLGYDLTGAIRIFAVF